MSDHDSKPAAPAAATATVTETVKAVVKDAAGKTGEGFIDRLMEGAVKLAKAFGGDAAFHVMGAPILDRILGREKLAEAERHAEAGNFEEAWETLHGHLNERRRRYSKAELRVRRQRFGATDTQFDAYDNWFAARLPYQQEEWKHFFERYVDRDEQAQDLAAVIRMTDAQRNTLLVKMHEPGLMDAMRANHAAVRASNRRLDREYIHVRNDIRRGAQYPHWYSRFRGLFRIF